MTSNNDYYLTPPPKKRPNEEEWAVREKAEQAVQTALFPKATAMGGDLGIEGLPKEWTAAAGLAAISDALEGYGSAQDIALWGVALTDLLLHKNARYGNSALDPISVFAKGLDARTRLEVRMDDKISRIQRGDGTSDGESPHLDLAGYLILWLICRWQDGK
jgi:hypothetical protein